MLRRRRNHSFLSRAIDHKIGIAANRDRSLAWEQAEDLRCTRASHIDKPMKIQLTLLDPIGKKKVYSLFDTGNAVGNLRKRVFAQEFLMRYRKDSDP